MRLLKVKILDTVLEAPLLNPNVAKRYEEGIATVLKTVEESNKCSSGAEAIEMQCEAVIVFVDNVFGEGSSAKVFGKETDLITCLDAWRDIVNIYPEQVNPVIANKKANLVAKGKR